MRHRVAAATRPLHTSGVAMWGALALVLVLMLLVAPRSPIAWASNGGRITIQTPPDGLFAPGSSLTASFSTEGTIYGNTPLSVTFVSSASGTAIRSTYTILSAAGTTYTASIPIPDLVPGQYTLSIEGQEIYGGRLTSAPITVAAPTPTPLPSTAPVLIGTQAHVVPPGPGLSGGVIAAAAAGLLLAVGLALLIVPPFLRRRGNQPPR